MCTRALNRYDHGFHPAGAAGARGTGSREPGFLARVPDAIGGGVFRGMEGKFPQPGVGGCAGQRGRWGHVPARSADGCEFSFFFIRVFFCGQVEDGTILGLLTISR